jgi:hypothetical protein
MSFVNQDVRSVSLVPVPLTVKKIDSCCKENRHFLERFALNAWFLVAGEKGPPLRRKKLLTFPNCFATVCLQKIQVMGT